MLIPATIITIAINYKAIKNLLKDDLIEQSNNDYEQQENRLTTENQNDDPNAEAMGMQRTINLEVNQA